MTSTGECASSRRLCVAVRWVDTISPDMWAGYERERGDGRNFTGRARSE